MWNHKLSIIMANNVEMFCINVLKGLKHGPSSIFSITREMINILDSVGQAVCIETI